MAAINTRILIVDPTAPDPTTIAQAAALLRAGQLVAFPTETVYGLGADGLNQMALAEIYAAKGRPTDNPLILHLADQAQLAMVAVDVPPIAEILMQIFWPGPLTLVLPKHPSVPDRATGGLTTVAVRMPAHPVALALIAALGAPLAAPSANRSGCPSPTTAGHVLDDLGGSIAMILDGGPTMIGVESTVLDVTCAPPILLRPGGLPRESIEAIVGPLQGTDQPAIQRRSPGTRYRHYSPRAHLHILPEASNAALQSAVTIALVRHRRVGCLLRHLELTEGSPSVIVRRVSGDPLEYARALFAALRQLDAQGVEVIIVEGIAEEGIGLAVMDRLRRAASPPAI